MSMVADVVTHILSEEDVHNIERAIENSSFDQVIKGIIKDLLSVNNEGVDLRNYPARGFPFWYLVNNFFKSERLPYQLFTVKNDSSVYKLFGKIMIKF